MTPGCGRSRDEFGTREPGSANTARVADRPNR